jgi:tRNA(Ile)-lysidine synthase
MVREVGPDTGCLRLTGETVAVPPGWRVRARRPGDRIRERPDRSRRKLKELFQSAGVPPWLRPGVPILEWDGEPVALGDWVIGPRLRAWLEEHDLEYRWEPADPVLVRVRADLQPEG